MNTIKIGDFVQVNSIEWYYRMNDKNGSVHFDDGRTTFTNNEANILGKIVLVLGVGTDDIVVKDLDDANKYVIDSSIVRKMDTLALLYEEVRAMRKVLSTPQMIIDSNPLNNALDRLQKENASLRRDLAVSLNKLGNLRIQLSEKVDLKGKHPLNPGEDEEIHKK